MSNYKGIEYKPNLDYELGDIPPGEFLDQVIETDNNLATLDLSKKVNVVGNKLDFLIMKAEEKLEPSYVSVARKKYVCQLILSTEESILLNRYEEEQGSINGDIVVDVYKRLLMLKSEMKTNENSINELNAVQIASMKKYSNYINQQYDFDEDLELDDDAGIKDSLSNLSKQLNLLTDKKSIFRSQYENAIDEGKSEEIDIYLNKMDELDKEMSYIRNRLGYTASESYGIYKKLDNTDDFLGRAGYLVLSSPYDRLGDTVCCFIKLLLKQAGIEGDIKDPSIKLNSAINKIDSLRALLAMLYTDKADFLGKLEDRLLDELRSALYPMLKSAIAKMRAIESHVVHEVEMLFKDVSDVDTESPDNMLDCLYFEGLADLIYDKIDGIFEEIKSNIIDLYKLILSRADLFDETAIGLFDKSRIKEVYTMLTKLSNKLKAVDEVSFGTGLENWIESFLIESGYGTSYNPRSGKFENISLDGCVVPVKNDGSYRDFLPNNPDEVPEIRLSNNQEFQQFVKNDGCVEITC